jgi:hypothetical protein
MFFLDFTRDSLPGIFQNLRLDIVGIIAILGDGGVSRNAQVAALSWYNNIPRLLPAPQALLKQERDRRLPIESGTVVGVYSGNVRHNLNFFTSVLHPHQLKNYEVEFLQVDPKYGEAPDESYGARHWGELFCLSLVGCSMSLALVALSVYYRDGNVSACDNIPVNGFVTGRHKLPLDIGFSTTGGSQPFRDPPTWRYCHLLP